METSDIITAENLQLWYGDTHALKGIDMAIPEKKPARTRRQRRSDSSALSIDSARHNNADQQNSIIP